MKSKQKAKSSLRGSIYFFLFLWHFDIIASHKSMSRSHMHKNPKWCLTFVHAHPLWFGRELWTRKGKWNLIVAFWKVEKKNVKTGSRFWNVQKITGYGVWTYESEGTFTLRSCYWLSWDRVGYFFMSCCLSFVEQFIFLKSVDRKCPSWKEIRMQEGKIDFTGIIYPSFHIFI